MRGVYDRGGPDVNSHRLSMGGEIVEWKDF